MAAADPIKAAKRCQTEISAMNTGFHNEMRLHIAEAYAVARELQKDQQAWEKFIEDDFWQQRKKKPAVAARKAPLLHVMVFVFDAAVDRNRYKRASKYATALKGYWTRNVPAREVAAKIEDDGGIEALCQASAGNKLKKAKREQSLKLLPVSDAYRKKILALPIGKRARLMIKSVNGERGEVAIITGFSLWGA
jgi:predicted acyl esterase